MTKQTLIKLEEKSLFASLQQRSDALKASGYITDSVTVSTVYLAAHLHKPLFLEGVAGGGKTQLVYAIAEAATRTLQMWMGHRDIKSTMVYLKGVQSKSCIGQSERRRLGSVCQVT